MVMFRTSSEDGPRLSELLPNQLLEDPTFSEVDPELFRDLDDHGRGSLPRASCSASGQRGLGRFLGRDVGEREDPEPGDVRPSLVDNLVGELDQEGPDDQSDGLG
jgi:hypothetical protein